MCPFSNHATWALWSLVQLCGVVLSRPYWLHNPKGWPGSSVPHYLASYNCIHPQLLDHVFNSCSFRTCGLPMLLLGFLTTYWMVFKGKHPEEERKWRITGGTKVALLQSKAIHRAGVTADVQGHQFLWPQQKDFRQGAHNSTLEEEWKGNTLRRENGSS